MLVANKISSGTQQTNAPVVCQLAGYAGSHVYYSVHTAVLLLYVRSQKLNMRGGQIFVPIDMYKCGWARHMNTSK